MPGPGGEETQDALRGAATGGESGSSQAWPEFEALSGALDAVLGEIRTSAGRDELWTSPYSGEWPYKLEEIRAGIAGAPDEEITRYARIALGGRVWDTNQAIQRALPREQHRAWHGSPTGILLREIWGMLNRSTLLNENLRSQVLALEERVGYLETAAAAPAPAEEPGQVAALQEALREGLEQVEQRADAFAEQLRRELAGTRSRHDELVHSLATLTIQVDTARSDTTRNDVGVREALNALVARVSALEQRSAEPSAAEEQLDIAFARLTLLEDQSAEKSAVAEQLENALERLAALENRPAIPELGPAAGLSLGELLEREFTQVCRYRAAEWRARIQESEAAAAVRRQVPKVVAAGIALAEAALELSGTGLRMRPKLSGTALRALGNLIARASFVGELGPLPPEAPGEPLSVAGLESLPSRPELRWDVSELQARGPVAAQEWYWGRVTERLEAEILKLERELAAAAGPAPGERETVIVEWLREQVVPVVDEVRAVLNPTSAIGRELEALGDPGLDEALLRMHEALSQLFGADAGFEEHSCAVGEPCPDLAGVEYEGDGFSADSRVTAVVQRGLRWHGHPVRALRVHLARPRDQTPDPRWPADEQPVPAAGSLTPPAVSKPSAPAPAAPASPVPPTTNPPRRVVSV